MHHIYQTKAFVVTVVPYKEADSFITLFTKELGLIRAVASGIRYSKSKLRFSLQPYSLVDVSLVRGKGMWRITNAVYEDSAYYRLPEKSRLLFVQMMQLLKRLIQGEQQDEELFSIMHGAYLFLKNNPVEEQSLIDIECVLSLRILHRLGYIGENKKLNFFIHETSVSNLFISEMKKERHNALEEISRALHDSQL